MSDEINLSTSSFVPNASTLSLDPEFIQFATQLLAQSDFAEGLTPKQKAALVAIGERRQYAPGDQVFDEHARSDEIYIIEAGGVDVWIDPYSIGDETNPPRKIASLLAGQTCGEMSLIDGGVRSARVVAGANGAKLMAITRSSLDALCEADTAIGYRLMRNLAGAMALRLRLQDMKMYSD